MGMHRLKQSFTSGEQSPLLNDRTDQSRYKDGCRKLENMLCAIQGAATRRPGTKYIYDLNDLGIDLADPRVREIPFIYNENEAYALYFFMHDSGFVHMVIGTTKSDGTDGLVVFDDPPITECPGGVPIVPLPLAGDIVTVIYPAGWDIDNFDWAQTNNEMYFAQSGLKTHILTRESNTCWYLSEITMTDAPTEWSDADGWPEKVTFHQQRLVLAGSTSAPQTVWTSVAGYANFHNFGELVPGTPGDADAITFTLDSQTQNKIQWISSGKTLHIGTLGNEWSVVGGANGILTPSTVLASRQTNNGSEPNKALLIGLTTLFIERHGRVVNEFTYDYTYDGYKTSDMAVLSSHITDFYSFVDWSYQQTPDSIVWLVREDGILAGITYQRQHKIIGWHRHITQGEFKAITVIPGNTREDDVWVTVKREIEGVDHYFIEKFGDTFKGPEAKDARFLDSYLDRDGAPVNEVYVPHLAGKMVNIICDGTVHPPATAELDGRVQLNNMYSNIAVGLGFSSELQPNLADIPASQTSGRDAGTSLGRTQRISYVDIDFYQTLGGFVGRIDEEGERHEEEIAFRTPGDLTGQAVPLWSGWKHLDFPEGFSRDPIYYIKQEQPLPMTVRCVIDVSEVFS